MREKGERECVRKREREISGGEVEIEKMCEKENGTEGKIDKGRER